MLRVDSSLPCKIVYSLCKHEFLGFLIEPHIVQLNQDGDFSLTHQRLFSNTAEEFQSFLDDTDLRLIKILEDIEQAHIIKRFYKKAIRPTEYFSNIFDEQVLQVVRPKIDKVLVQALRLIEAKELYCMSKEGWPVEKRLHFATEPASVLFHFKRNEVETRYYPTIKYQGYRIEFMFKDALVICNEPARLLLEDVIYSFDQELEGKKLQPFLKKRFISIPRSSEPSYFEKFVAPLIEKHNVHAEGFTIRTEKYQATPVLRLIKTSSGAETQLLFRYGNYLFPSASDKMVSVKTEKIDDSYVFHRIRRSVNWEKGKIAELEKLGLNSTRQLFSNMVMSNGQNEVQPYFDIIDWVNSNHDQLEALGFELEQAEGQTKYVLGTSKIDLEFKENNDWFDINAVVHFGPYRIPFIDLKQHILNRIREFTLPSGEVAIIPEAWFSQYGNLIYFAEGQSRLKIKKHHIGLVNDFANSELAGVSMDRKLQKLTGLIEIEEENEPEYFKGILRPYQKAGYDWFHFLAKYNFGGCLADDMGLGKTVQTLALLQKVKEQNPDAFTSLIIMPTSLIYNWINEAEKFAPGLRILVHTGSFRDRSGQNYAAYDIVITTYGVTRIDIDLLKEFYFNYIILDESQNIKNPASKSYKAIKLLKSKHKLILSGTPVENTVNDLWTQMSFINPGLLGTQKYFQTEFVLPIEKKKDVEKARKLQAIIKPFVLRRTKDQVAKELPPKTENLFYCKMSEEQNQYYEQIKSEYRNELLKTSLDGTFKKSQIHLLQGLTKLRQIANHPEMIDQEYEGDSGKFENVIHTLESVLSRGHKVLIFSQFVKQLSIYRRHFDEQQTPYMYLDGATQNRGEVVKEFQENDSVRLFLISIKAGGVGLNLTEADYVFILDPWWNPAVEQQAIDRTHRIGQTKNIFIYKFITKDSVEEKILALQNRKKFVANSLITTEESFVKSLSEEDIRELLS